MVEKTKKTDFAKPNLDKSCCRCYLSNKFYGYKHRARDGENMQEKKVTEEKVAYEARKNDKDRDNKEKNKQERK